MALAAVTKIEDQMLLEHCPLRAICLSHAHTCRRGRIFYRQHRERGWEPSHCVVRQYCYDLQHGGSSVIEKVLQRRSEERGRRSMKWRPISTAWVSRESWRSSRECSTYHFVYDVWQLDSIPCGQPGQRRHRRRQSGIMRCNVQSWKQ
jgi:hypothetical protein